MISTCLPSRGRRGGRRLAPCGPLCPDQSISFYPWNICVRLSANSGNLWSSSALYAPLCPEHRHSSISKEKFREIQWYICIFTFSAKSENCEQVLHPAPWCPGHGIPFYPYHDTQCISVLRVELETCGKVLRGMLHYVLIIGIPLFPLKNSEKFSDKKFSAMSENLWAGSTSCSLVQAMAFLSILTGIYILYILTGIYSVKLTPKSGTGNLWKRQKNPKMLWKNYVSGHAKKKWESSVWHAPLCPDQGISFYPGKLQFKT